MIVVSGALVALAAGLLVDGVFFTGDTAGTPWQVWASIAVSAGAAVLLVAGALRERGRRPPQAEAAAAPPGSLPAVAPETLRIPASGAAPAPAPPAPAPPQATAAPLAAQPAPPAGVPAATAAGGEVLVVPGRPRYHLAGCRYVEGRDPQPLDVSAARAAGYTSCGVCRPDELIAATAGDDADVLADELAAAQPHGQQQAVPPVPQVVPPTSAPPLTPPAAAPPFTGGIPAPQVDDAEEAADAAEAAAAAAPVVLVRNHFHRPDCRYVAVATDRREVSRADARQAGALPCSVCLP